MKSKVGFILILSSVVLFSSTIMRVGFAATNPAPLPGKPIKPSPLKEYLSKVDKKFDAGMVNFLIGWTEILTEPMDHYQKAEKNKRLMAGCLGFGEGMGNAVLDTIGGFLKILISPAPQFEIPLPEGGIDVEKITG